MSQEIRPTEVVVLKSVEVPVSNTHDHSNVKVDAHVTNEPKVHVQMDAQNWQYRLCPFIGGGEVNWPELEKLGNAQWEAVGVVPGLPRGGILMKRPG